MTTKTNTQNLKSPITIPGVEDIRTKPMVFEAMQFTGKNGRDVVRWMESKGGRAVNGGSYLKLNRTNNSGKILLTDGSEVFETKILKGTVILFDPSTEVFADGVFVDIPFELYQQDFQQSKKSSFKDFSKK